VALYLCLSDIHARRHPPVSCTETYWPDLLDLLKQSVKVARQYGVIAVVWAGDVFDHKAPGRTDHGIIQDLQRVIRSYPCPVFITPGNHDMQHDRIESIVSTQPLGVLYGPGFGKGVANELVRWGGYDAEQQYFIYGVPWLQAYGEYTEEADTAVGQAFEVWRHEVFERGTGSARPLVVAHAPLYPPGQESPWEHFPAERWAEAMGGAGHVFYGHVHPSHGVYEAGGVTFCNNGALSRGSLDESNLNRPVGVTIYDDQTGGFEFVELAYRPADQVFKLAEHGEAVTAQKHMADFLERAGGAVTLPVLTIGSVMEEIRRRKPGEAVVDLAEEILAEVSEPGRKRR
jgi:DNA repair exonuclease SbcCD nuclease subunit